MEFHWTVGSGLGRLAAALMIAALLVGPHAGTAQPQAPDRAADSSEDTGMKAPPAPPASAAISAVPHGAPVTAWAATVRVAEHPPRAARRPPEKTLVPAVPMSSARTILRI
jgi:hypothetical protein